ncbi:MAG: PaaI family thioesterase [Candidatus Dormibacterales bacterium]
MEVGTPSPAWARLGIRALGSDRGRGVAEMETGPDMLSRRGAVHTGFLGALADSAMALAVDGALAPGVGRTTFDLKLSVVAAPGAGQRLRAVARVVHLGRRTAFADCRVESGEGGLVATASATFRLRGGGGAD